MTSPQLSAIIPTRDRPGLLRDCLGGLAAQDIEPGRLEVIVVDDGSEADLASVVAAVDQPWFRYVRQEGAGLNPARNCGAAVATGAVLAFLDDDTLVPSVWAKAVLSAFEHHRCQGLAGRILLELEGPAPRWLTPGLRSFLSELDLGDDPRWIGDGVLPYGANCAVSRAAFEEAGGFATGLDRRGTSLLSGGDTEFFSRVEAGGGRLFYQPAAVVRHRVPEERLTLQWFRQRARAAGRTDALLNGGGRSRAGVAREVLRSGRAVPIAVKGLLAGHGLAPAAIWSSYCRGRLEAGTPG